MLNNLWMIFAWIKFRLKSVNAHGLHSPFFFSLYYKLKDQNSYYIFEPLNSLRSQLLLDQREINVYDAGAGSHILGKKTKRNISSIASTSLKKKKGAEILFKLVEEFECLNILELGTSLGLTTCYLAGVRRENRVISIEASEEIANIARENISKLKLTNIEIIVGKFDDVLESVLESNDKLDFVFIDGDHRAEAVMNNFNKILPKIHNDSIVVLDDIHWSKGMEEAWQVIIKDPKVKASVDLFDMGILFFRKELSKEDFVIRL